MTQPEQLGFGFDQILEEQRTAYLPSTMQEAIPFYRKLIERHHEAMLSGNVEKTMAIRNEAHDLAIKLNGGTLLGICGGPDAPACVLERETAAAPGTVPLWGQEGSFTVYVNGTEVRIEQDGMFGVATGTGFWPGFGAHAVDYHRPFISQTGYRSFIGCHADVVPGITPDMFAREIIQAHIQRDCKGKLTKIERSYVERERSRQAGRVNSRQQME